MSGEQGRGLRRRRGELRADAKNYSPAAFTNVLTVSALADFNGLAGGGAASTCRADVDDTLADFSNWGSAVDVAAPGVCILSTYPVERGGYGTISGTSMASPHAAGALALLASKSRATSANGVAGLYDQVKTAGNVNWTDDSGDGFKERLLDVSTSPFAPKLIAGSGGGEPVNAAPKASFTSSCSRLDCTFTSTSTDLDGSIVGWEWKFGDGVTDTVGAVVKHTYLSPGTYRVELVVTDNRGATSTFSQNVTVKNRGGK